MTKSKHSIALLMSLALCGPSGAALVACSDPFSFDATVQSSAGLQNQEEPEEEEICGASQEWLPKTPPLDLFMPLPHPATECPFYRGSWQNFLIATQPDAEGKPDFLNWPTITTLFESSKLRGDRSVLGDIRQAGGRQIVIDQNGRALYYGIHVNQAYADFVRANGLTTVAGIQAVSPRLFFPAGVVELKSAWMDISGEPVADYADYITTTTSVPTLSKDTNGQIVEDRNQPRFVKLALIALHVVYTLPGHPEFIWGSFEHSTGAPDISAKDGKRDVAPTFRGANPSADDPDNLSAGEAVSATDSKLYKAGTPANRANQAISEVDLRLDPTSQSFPGQQTSIYRMFPASKSHSTDPDAALSSLNFNVGQLFAAKQRALSSVDKRGFYRQIGSVWMDKPDYFVLDSSLQNDATSPLVSGNGAAAVQDLAENGADSEFSLLAGEDRLSSTAMESFTQGPTAFPNCFSCHNTQAVTARGTPAIRDTASAVLLQPKRINVSHVFSEFVLEETSAP
jgi:hypothetical protein